MRGLKRLGGQGGWAAIVFGDAALSMTVARPGAGDVHVLQEAAAELPAVEGTPDPRSQWRTAAGELSRKFDASEHRVVMALRCEDVLFQTLQVPTTAPGELKQMLDLQLDNLTPLPPEEVVFDFEPLEVSETQTRVLVAVARRDVVNAQVEALETVGLPPQVVKVDALAVFRAMIKRQLLPADSRLSMVVALTPTAVNVIVHADGKPFSIRSLLLEPGTLGTADGLAALREELQRTFLAMQSEHLHRERGQITFVAASDELRATAEQIATDWGIEPHVLTNGAVPNPSLSLCLETAAGDAARLNLLPQEWRDRRHAAQVRQRLVRLGIAAALVYVLALCSFLTVMAVRRGQVRSVRGQIDGLQGDFTKTKQTRDELFAMQNQLNTKNSSLEVLREVSTMIPENVKLTGFDYRKDLTVKLRGQAQSFNLANDFLGKLERCPLFTTVKVTTKMTGDANGLTRFDIVCTLKTATGGATPAHGTE